MYQAKEDSKRPSKISYHVFNDNKLRELHRNFVKPTVARRQYSRAELCTRNTKTENTAIVLNAMNRRWIPFHCRVWVCTVAYIGWFSSTAAKRVTKRPHEDFDAQALRI